MTMRFSVRVHPRSSRTAIRRTVSGDVELWTTAPPADGKANDAVRRLIADWLGVPVSQVRIVGGLTARAKTLQVEGVDVLPSC